LCAVLIVLEGYGTTADCDRSWYSVLPDGVTVVQPVKKFSARISTARFVIRGSLDTGSCPFPEPEDLQPSRANHPVSLCSSFYAWVSQLVLLFRNVFCLHTVAAEMLTSLSKVS
jgi:hypothetical protein